MNLKLLERDKRICSSLCSGVPFCMKLKALIISKVELSRLVHKKSKTGSGIKNKTGYLRGGEKGEIKTAFSSGGSKKGGE